MLKQVQHDGLISWPFAGAGLALFAAALLWSGFAANAEPPLLPDIDLVTVDKSDRTLTLWSDGRAVRVIRGIQLGDAPEGPKRFESDERTPEGRYAIDWGNPDSAYHLSLHISYPDAADIVFAASQGRSAGGMIMIHGQPNALPAGRVPGDWTDGCIAVSNEEIELLWEHIPDGTPIEITA